MRTRDPQAQLGLRRDRRARRRSRWSSAATSSPTSASTCPTWVPVVGSDFVDLQGRVLTAQAITPGQGQTVNIAGVPVGEIRKVELDDGRAVVDDEDPAASTRTIYQDATRCCARRPASTTWTSSSTPGTRAAGEVDRTSGRSRSQTLPERQPRRVPRGARRATRAATCSCCVGGAARASTGNGKDLAATLPPLRADRRDRAKITKAARASAAHNIAPLDPQLPRAARARRRQGRAARRARRRLQRASSSHFANQDAKPARRRCSLLPGTLQRRPTPRSEGRQARRRRSGRRSARCAPAPARSGPSLRGARPFLSETTPIIENQLRPFARDALPTVKILRPAARDLADADAGPRRRRSTSSTTCSTSSPTTRPATTRATSSGSRWLNHIGPTVFSTAGRARPDPPRRAARQLRRRSACSDTLKTRQPAARHDHRPDATRRRSSEVCPLQRPGAPTTTAGRLRLNAEASPDPRKILIMAGFALSCFGLLLFLWLAFGGATRSSPRATASTSPSARRRQLAQQADVRISGVPVGKVKAISRQRADGRTDATIQLDARYAPIPRDARAILRSKTLLGETYVELTPGSHERPQGCPRTGACATGAGRRHRRARRDLPRARPADARGLPELDAVPGRRRWTGRGPGPQRRDRQPRAVRRGHEQAAGDPQRAEAGGAQLVRNTGDVFDALSERGGQLAGLITQLEHASSPRPPRATQRAAGDVPGAADVRARVERRRSTRLTAVLAQTRTRSSPSCGPAAQRAEPDAAGGWQRSRPTSRRSSSTSTRSIDASEKGLPAFERVPRRAPAAARPARARCAQLNPFLACVGAVPARAGPRSSATSSRRRRRRRLAGGGERRALPAHRPTR